MWKAVCIEKCMHGLEGGAGVSSSEVLRAYPTETIPIVQKANVVENMTNGQSRPGSGQ